MTMTNPLKIKTDEPILWLTNKWRDASIAAIEKGDETAAFRMLAAAVMAYEAQEFILTSLQEGLVVQVTTEGDFDEIKEEEDEAD